MFQHLDQAYDFALERWEAAQSRLEASERRHGRAPIWQEFADQFLVKLSEVEQPTFIVGNTSSLRSSLTGAHWGGTTDDNREWIQQYLSSDMSDKPHLPDLFKALDRGPLSGRYIVLITGALPEHHNRWLAQEIALAKGSNWEFGIGLTADAFEAKWPSILKCWSSSVTFRDLDAYHTRDTFFEPGTRVWLTSGRSPMAFLKKS